MDRISEIRLTAEAERENLRRIAAGAGSGPSIFGGEVYLADVEALLERIDQLEAAIRKHQTDFNESDDESDNIHEALWSHVSEPASR